MIASEFAHRPQATALTMTVPVTFRDAWTTPVPVGATGRLLVSDNAATTGGLCPQGGVNAEIVTDLADRQKVRVVSGRAWSPPI